MHLEKWILVADVVPSSVHPAFSRHSFFFFLMHFFFFFFGFNFRTPLVLDMCLRSYSFFSHLP